MKQLTMSDALNLVGSQAKPAISIYVGTDSWEKDDPEVWRKKLQQLYKKAESMVSRAYDSKTREKLLQPLKKSLKLLRPDKKHSGLAIYHTEDFSGLVWLPTSVPDLAVTANSFHLKPVLRCSQVKRSYYLLVFRRRYAELLLVTADETSRLERFELKSRQENQEVHEWSRGHWHQGGARSRRQKDVRIAMDLLSRQLDVYWHGDSRPLVLAGPRSQLRSFRFTCQYPFLLDKECVGTFDERDNKFVQKYSDQIAENSFQAAEDQAIASYRKAEAWALTTTDLRLTALAAVQGQIHSLFIADDKHVWGTMDRDSGALQIAEQQSEGTYDDLLDDIAEQVILKHGRVMILPSHRMPRGQTIAAILRWGNGDPRQGLERSAESQASIASMPSQVIISA